jgi:hypothetical protein
VLVQLRIAFSWQLIEADRAESMHVMRRYTIGEDAIDTSTNINLFYGFNPYE